MTLALLLTAVTGAWAQDPTVNFPSEITVGEEFSFSFDATDNVETVYLEIGNVFEIFSGISSNGGTLKYTYNGDLRGETAVALYFIINDIQLQVVKSVTIKEPAPAEITEWSLTSKDGKNWILDKMPASDVEIAPIYAPVAQWAKVENVDQLPTAIEGIYAGTTDAIVKAGTVAKIGNTENLQGTLMYAVGTSATEQPALTAFSATLPTAKDITTAGDVYVWYYIKGADTPQGQTATAENTFNDSEICTTPIKVTVLSNKFNIQFTAANANTIEAGKAIVTVGGTAATVTEGKLESVKMGSEVKLKANTGYKFRKVEVKKKAAK